MQWKPSPPFGIYDYFFQRFIIQIYIRNGHKMLELQRTFDVIQFKYPLSNN